MNFFHTFSRPPRYFLTYLGGLKLHKMHTIRKLSKRALLSMKELWAKIQNRPKGGTSIGYTLKFGARLNKSLSNLARGV